MPLGTLTLQLLQYLWFVCLFILNFLASSCEISSEENPEMWNSHLSSSWNYLQSNCRAAQIPLCVSINVPSCTGSIKSVGKGCLLALLHALHSGPFSCKCNAFATHSVWLTKTWGPNCAHCYALSLHWSMRCWISASSHKSHLRWNTRRNREAIARCCSKDTKI